MAATLHIIRASDNLKRKRLHEEIQGFNKTAYDRRLRRHHISHRKPVVSHKQQNNENFTPPPSLFSGVSSPESSPTSSEHLDCIYNKKSKGIDIITDELHGFPKKKPNQQVNIRVDTGVANNQCMNKNNASLDSLESNSDYIMLCSTLNLLYSLRQKVKNDIVELNKLKKDLKENPAKLRSLLDGSNNEIPSRNSILKCPIIDFTNYGLSYRDEQTFIHDELTRENSEQKELFKVTSPFG